MRALIAVLASAVAYGLCFPPNAIRPLAWIALVPLLVTVRRVSTAKAVGLGWVWTIAIGYALNDWFPRAVSAYFAQPALLGAALFLGVCTFTGAPAFVLFLLCYRRIVRRGSSTATPLLVAAAWVATELFRATLLGDPWALLGYSQVGILPLVQIADITGVYGTSFVLAAVNAAVAELWMARGVRDHRAQAARGLAAALGGVALVAAYGAVRLNGVDRAGGAVIVGVVQGNLDVGSQWREELYGANLDAYLGLTRELARTAEPRLVVWPESAMTFLVDEQPGYREYIGSTLRGSGVQLLAGGPRADPDGARFYNTAFLLAAGGDVVAWYDKEHLLPFAEYFPAGLSVLRRRFARVDAFAPGSPRPPLPTAAGPAGVIICNEGMFPEPAAARVRAGAAFLVQLSNDSWLGDRKFSEPTFEMSVLRAIEQRRYLVRASTAGPSGIVDPGGRVVTRTAFQTAATFAGAIEPSDDVTPYGRVGDLFAVACAVITAAACRAAGRDAIGGGGRT